MNFAMTKSSSQGPKLLKARIRHSRWFALLLFPIIIFCVGMQSDEGIIHEMMDWTGLYLVIICVLGRVYCSTYIGGIKNEIVVREGPYSIVRNPLYVFSFFGVVGIGLQSGMFTFLSILIVAFILYYRVVVRREEAFLLDKFGDSFALYCREVPRWIPKFTLWHEPVEATVRPKFVRRTILDVVWFFLPMPIFELLEILRDHHVVPIWFTIP